MTRENKVVFGVAGAMVVAVIVFVVVSGALGGRSAPAEMVQVAATPTPPASAEARAAATEKLTAATALRASGQFAPAIALAQEALALWPDFADAERFVASAAPEATAVEDALRARGVVATQQAAAIVTAGAEARRLYSTSAQRPLQRYVDTMGALRQSAREAAERPALLNDVTWRSGTTERLATMQSAADEMAAVVPVPDGMAPAVAVLSQIAGETRLLAADYTPGLAQLSVDGNAAARVRIDRIVEMAARANVEVRRTPSA